MFKTPKRDARVSVLLAECDAPVRDDGRVPVSAPDRQGGDALSGCRGIDVQFPAVPVVHIEQAAGDDRTRAADALRPSPHEPAVLEDVRRESLVRGNEEPGHAALLPDSRCCEHDSAPGGGERLERSAEHWSLAHRGRRMELLQVQQSQLAVLAALDGEVRREQRGARAPEVEVFRRERLPVSRRPVLEQATRVRGQDEHARRPAAVAVVHAVGRRDQKVFRPRLPDGSGPRPDRCAGNGARCPRRLDRWPGP